MNLRIVAHHVALMVMGFSSFSAVATLFALAAGEKGVSIGFLCTTVVCLGAGGLTYLSGRKKVEFLALGRREALATVSLTWCVVSVLGALPFVLCGVAGPLDAVFETVSGLTTTGASIFTDVERLPRSILLWRGMTQWIGGIGIIAVFVALIPSFGVGARFMFMSESPGPEKEASTPRIRSLAVRVVGIYVALTAVFILALWVAGMSLFESTVHTMAGLATGGFSSRNASIGAYPVHIAWIVILMMAAGGTNFGLFHAMLKGGIGVVWRSSEFRWYVGILAVASLAVAADFYLRGNLPNLGRAALDGTFSVVSVQTTTGFATYDFDRGSSFAKFVLLGVMIVGASGGSTGGGLKVSRFVICAKSAWLEIVKIVRPWRVLVLRFDGHLVDAATQQAAMGVAFAYALTLGLSVLVAAAMGLDFQAALSGTVATLSNVGPGFSVIGPMSNYAAVPAPAKAVFIVDMLVGRLEFYPLLAVLSRSFWKS